MLDMRPSKRETLQIYDRVGWTACVAVLAAVLAGAIAIARVLRTPKP